MIVTQLSCGLGNQMFQYAMGRALSLRNRDALMLDMGAFARSSKRRYELCHFPVQGVIADEKVNFPRGRKKALWMRISAGQKWTIKREENFLFDPKSRQWRGNLFLAGYWQSEKYFADCSEVIRSDFSRGKDAFPDELPAIRQMTQEPSVSLHFRRGDYVEDPKNKVRFNQCPMDYYSKALALIAEKVGDLRVYVFSDDIGWVRENVRFSFPTRFVSRKGDDDPSRDLFLMACCRHHIIANSTFSWWGAWLGDHQDKIVVAPRQWFTDPVHDTTDLIPEKWHKL